MTLYIIPSDQLYAVVELTKEGKIYSSPAPSRWLYNVLISEDGKKTAKCFWPPDEARLSDYLEKRKKPEPSQWLQFDVTILKLCKTFAGAKSGATAALDKSDLSTSEGDLPAKRQRTAKTIFDPSASKPAVPTANTESSDDSSSDEEVVKVKPSSKTKSIFLKSDSDDESEMETSPTPEKVSVAAKGKQRSKKRAGGVTPSAGHVRTPKSDDPVNPRKDKDANQRPEDNAGSVPENDVVNPRKDKDANQRPEDNADLVPDPEDSAGIVPEADGDNNREADGDNNREADGDNNREADGDHNREANDESRDLNDTLPIEDASDDDSAKAVASSSRANGSSSASPGRSNAAISFDRNLMRTKSFCYNRTSFYPPKKPSPRKPEQMRSGTQVCLREVAGLREDVTKLMVIANKIMFAVCPELEVSHDDDDDTPTLPLKDKASMRKRNAFVKDPQNQITMVNLLASYGSDSAKESTYAMLRKLLSNKLACIFNVKGKNKPDALIKKKPFQGTRAYTVLHAAVVKHNNKLQRSSCGFNAEPKNIDKFIGDWLKDAPKRAKNESLAEEQHDDSDSGSNDDVLGSGAA